VLDVQHRIDSLEQRPAVPSFNPAVFDILERRIIDLTAARNMQVSQAIHDVSASLSQALHDVEERLVHQGLLAKGDTENRLQSLNEALVSFVDLKQQQNLSIIASAKEGQALLIADLRQSIDVIRRQVASSSSTRPQANSSTPESGPVIDDGLYVALENHFRGSRDIVAERQREYLSALPSTITETTPLIDLGCGRGEWLAVLRENHIAAVGVDSNSVCAAECRESGLNVHEQDLLTFLAERPDASVGAYTMFQVLEHLPFPVLLEALRHIRRTLVAGGLLIAEVPNAKNLRVASGTFWIDPTHQRPLFPELLLFLATELGFNKAEGRYVNDFSPKHDLDGLPEGAQVALQSILYAIDGPGDFALLATA
jgi:SAM-dependent methyltransferase